MNLSTESKPIVAPEQFLLKDSDKSSETWGRLRRHLESRIEYLRLKLEAESSEAQTSNLRGRIAEIRNLLALGKDN